MHIYIYIHTRFYDIVSLYKYYNHTHFTKCVYIHISKSYILENPCVYTFICIYRYNICIYIYTIYAFKWCNLLLSLYFAPQNSDQEFDEATGENAVQRNAELLREIHQQESVGCGERRAVRGVMGKLLPIRGSMVDVTKGIFYLHEMVGILGGR